MRLLAAGARLIRNRDAFTPAMPARGKCGGFCERGFGHAKYARMPSHTPTHAKNRIDQSASPAAPANALAAAAVTANKVQAPCIITHSPLWTTGTTHLDESMRLALALTPREDGIVRKAMNCSHERFAVVELRFLIHAGRYRLRFTSDRRSSIPSLFWRDCWLVPWVWGC